MILGHDDNWEDIRSEKKFNIYRPVSEDVPLLSRYDFL